jgi:hypothetical protein
MSRTLRPTAKTRSIDIGRTTGFGAELPRFRFEKADERTTDEYSRGVAADLRRN